MGAYNGVTILHECIGRMVMGCLLEFIMEVVGEGVIESFAYCYLQLMQLIVPDKAVSEKTKKITKIIATTMAAVLLVALIVGLGLFVQEDPATINIGKYVLAVSLSVIVLQVLLGAAMRIADRFKK